MQGGSFASRQKCALESASLAENLQNPARTCVIAGSEYRVTTAASLLLVTRRASHHYARPLLREYDGTNPSGACFELHHFGITGADYKMVRNDRRY
jgi:hypothetical protein